ncbi:hypothetical protein [Micromonospora sp. NBC_01796]|uniref:hypothetical protein n=1 Tax=Micromonospora sp. NBC_01796 TaxID=2975987 RepID=UPI002DD8920A|nr:hypothetical protein [Micromonospora sp. NBC_01796]WSA85066.1 hypothetical protein OIE47_32685 [Micromonospora sp. NBC_01796]
MALPVARSEDEAQLYLDLHPCERCQVADVDWRTAPGQDEGAPSRRYYGVCRRCQASREFAFRLPGRPTPPGPDDLVFFGGPEPSQLFDAGEWRLISDAGIHEGGAPPDTGSYAERKHAFALGVAALAEVLKFIPDGADAVPETAFWTPHGRAAYDQKPDRFTREYLERWLDGFQEELEARFRD